MSDETGRLREQPDSQAKWEAWFRAVYPRLYYLVMRRTRHKSLCEELVQISLMKFFQAGAISKVENNDQAVAYLQRIAFNSLADQLARQVPVGDADVEVMPDRSIETEPADIEWMAGQLSPANRDLLLLLIEGWTVAEIAERLGISYSAASKRLQRLRQDIMLIEKNLSNHSVK